MSQAKYFASLWSWAVVCPLSPSLVSYALQFKNNLLFRACSGFALTWFLLLAFPLTLFLHPPELFPCQSICTPGLSPAFQDFINYFFCPITYLDFLFSFFGQTLNEGHSVKQDIVSAERLNIVERVISNICPIFPAFSGYKCPLVLLKSQNCLLCAFYMLKVLL